MGLKVMVVMALCKYSFQLDILEFVKKCMKLEPNDILTNKLAYIIKLYTH